MFTNHGGTKNTETSKSLSSPAASEGNVFAELTHLERSASVQPPIDTRARPAAAFDITGDGSRPEFHKSGVSFAQPRGPIHDEGNRRNRAGGVLDVLDFYEKSLTIR